MHKRKPTKQANQTVEQNFHNSYWIFPYTTAETNRIRHKIQSKKSLKIAENPIKDNQCKEQSRLKTNRYHVNQDIFLRGLKTDLADANI